MELIEIIDEQTLKRTIKRISYEILEKNNGTNDLVIVGVKTRGVYIANRIAHNIKLIEEIEVPVCELDITSYRDDHLKKDVNTSVINLSLDDKIVILVDDVLFTGRSVRAALDAIMDYGRPREIKLATLIDRGHRELPIRSDFVGKNIPTSKLEKVIVKLNEIDQIDGVFIKKLN
jgi:pyrimidine operon attenuation protein / uracil phosphoribosyltransferase